VTYAMDFGKDFLTKKGWKALSIESCVNNDYVEFLTTCNLF